MSSLSNAQNNMLLTYAVSTAPDPLQVSPMEGDPSIGALTIVVSNTTRAAIYCQQIVFSFNIGDLAQDLTAIAEGILAAASPSDQWEIAVTGPGIFTATPKQSDYGQITTDGLVFQIYNVHVNQQVGTFTLSVLETSSTDNVTFNDYSGGFDIAKFPYGFFVGNFTAQVPEIQNGQTVDLTWIGSSDATYTILYGSATPVNVNDVRSWTSPPLTASTEFILRASVQSQGETVDTYLSTGVVVANPNFTATTLDVLQGSTLNGPTTVGLPGNNAPLTVNGPATVGSSTVNAPLNVYGQLSVSGDTSVGALTADSLSTAGAILAQGSATADSLQVNGGAVVQGALSAASVQATGQVSAGSVQADSLTVIGNLLAKQAQIALIGGAQSINAGSYQASTDGLVIGVVGWPPSSSDPCVGWITGSTAGMTLRATGGNLGYGHYYSSNGNTFVMPVASGNSWSVSAQQGSYNAVAAPIWFYWVPLGTAPNGATFARIGEAEAVEAPMMEKWAREGQDDSRRAFIALLEHATGRSFDEATRQQFMEIMHKM